MKKLFAILMALLLVASFSVTAFATEGTDETIPSPTDVAKIVVEYDSEYPGMMIDVSKETYDMGVIVTFVAQDSDYDFLGFTVEGEYEVVSGGNYILDAAPERTGDRPTLVLKALSDLKVVAHYDIDVEVTEPTTATQPDDEEGDSPQTGDSMLVYCIAGALILGVVGFVFAGKQLVKKED
ncbi:MAG: hypothetical protein IKM59_06270 [Oscillospiraceae bacterium]|nr:hypothetical protein [Oscillospiraceae bacterium]